MRYEKILDKSKPTIYAVLILVVVASLLLIALFGLSYTKDHYACESCKSLGESIALRVFGYPIWKQRIRVSRSLTGKICKHRWCWYFANSTGILFNKENWDGPIGNYPWIEWTENTENGSLKSIR